ncbi:MULTISPECIES: FadR/GntR family transcriptional regulator [Microbacterium]|uniref:FadR family transcriptional regulator n=1 Tax=Microbacterium wangchenii TaxID=2541726 RepID=A0ABX5SWS9_9MICO|nr:MULTISPECIES: FCD domain-containing protein [Microbacterium]MCK6067463.1 FCD domain-containing protein [Microbacterium sp. EYE_512]QBR89602.1 FadR family transcriptional regulator [Microbacterium wangchenii]TFV80951.1 FadR family transcriptional regulator [Microbacterium sp. dk485]TXK16799.1 FadR family transcriptional regulator [Microbacterium wangchenii]
MEDRSALRAWQVVLEHIETELRAGRVAPGDRLAPERELATQLGVGRSSVREALRVLEVLGLLRTATGSGPTSGAMIVAAPRGGVSALLRLQVAANGFPVDDVVRTRVVLEAAALDELAGDPHRDTASAAAVLDAMDAVGLSPAEFLALDARFHLALVEASGNVVASAMMEGLRTAIESYVLAGATALDDWDGTAERLRTEHRAIVSAIDGGDGATARSLIHAHITRYYDEAGLARLS